jgi:hypothetical protein
MCFSPICKDKVVLLEGDANTPVGFISHSAKLGQNVVGKVGHIYHVNGGLLRVNNGKNY